MQSGTTGINTTRVYNPIKQAMDHDPQGVFVRKWLPVMRRVPDAWIFEPWKMPENVQISCGVTVGVDLPLPVVDLELATREAKKKMHILKGTPEVKQINSKVLKRHGSKSTMKSSKTTNRKAEKAISTKHALQQSFNF